jgi:feruloyl esterase
MTSTSAKRLVSISILSLSFCAASAPAASAATCTTDALTAFGIPNTTITSANVVAATASTPEYCDVRGTVATDGEGAGPGSARFQARLPLAWNGKYLASAPGALGGTLQPLISASDFATSLARGYAFVTNDGGHTAGFFDASWALIATGVPDAAKLTDYFYRATHQVTVATKALVRAYYGTDTIARSYFDGCSNAARNGLIAAMRYPGEFDGIIAGAPYVDARAQLAMYKNAKAFLNAFIPPSLLPAIDAAVRSSCDAADGVADGLIQNPAKCAFEPDDLVPGTLTQAQADALKIYLRGVRDEHDRRVFPQSSVSDLSASGPLGGFVPWAQAGPPVNPVAAQPWGNLAPLGWQSADSVIRHIVEQYAAFNSNLEWPQDDGVIGKDALKRFDAATDAGNTDDLRALSRYLRRGGKLIMYHGYSDPVLSPFRTVQFYQQLAKRRGEGPDIQKHARLFMVPGMLHCAGGPGPNIFDTLTALENWVERRVAPRVIVAAHAINGNPALGIDRTMPLCPFPARARYLGSGDVNDAANWRCSRRHGEPRRDDKRDERDDDDHVRDRDDDRD